MAPTGRSSRLRRSIRQPGRIARHCRAQRPRSAAGPACRRWPWRRQTRRRGHCLHRSGPSPPTACRPGGGRPSQQRGDRGPRAPPRGVPGHSRRRPRSGLPAPWPRRPASADQSSRRRLSASSAVGPSSPACPGARRVRRCLLLDRRPGKRLRPCHRPCHPCRRPSHHPYHPSCHRPCRRPCRHPCRRLPSSPRG